jgi:hypothetical protein
MNTKPKLSKKAIALLRKVQKTITEEPNRLLMGSWTRQVTEGKGEIFVTDYDPSEEISRPVPPCGTVGCIAGWTAINGMKNSDLPIVTINGKQMVDVTSIDDVEVEARELLGLTKDQAQSLFYLPNWSVVKNGGYKAWPKRFATAYGKAKTAKQRAKVTCDRIDYFIEHVA